MSVKPEEAITLWDEQEKREARRLLDREGFRHEYAVLSTAAIDDPNHPDGTLGRPEQLPVAVILRPAETMIELTGTACLELGHSVDDDGVEVISGPLQRHGSLKVALVLAGNLGWEPVHPIDGSSEYPPTSWLIRKPL